MAPRDWDLRFKNEFVRSGESSHLMPTSSTSRSQSPTNVYVIPYHVIHSGRKNGLIISTSICQGPLSPKDGYGDVYEGFVHQVNVLATASLFPSHSKPLPQPQQASSPATASLFPSHSKPLPQPQQASSPATASLFPSHSKPLPQPQQASSPATASLFPSHSKPLPQPQQASSLTSSYLQDSAKQAVNLETTPLNGRKLDIDDEAPVIHSPNSSNGSMEFPPADLSPVCLMDVESSVNMDTAGHYVIKNKAAGLELKYLTDSQRSVQDLKKSERPRNSYAHQVNGRSCFKSDPVDLY
ncbi:hypothetical protein Btru_006912 [Bulinus truncatus]|nr:hypothetical protein Btru_006912 [Bulinus truncatus]